MDFVKLLFFKKIQIKPFKKAISEDIIKNAEKEVEDLYEKFYDLIEAAAKTKEKELMNN